KSGPKRSLSVRQRQEIQEMLWQGLTELRARYRSLEWPGANPLQDAHPALESTVLNTYNFSPKKNLLAQLLTLNQQVAEQIECDEPSSPPACQRIIPTLKNW
ncbi:MAG: hypothetical protein ABIV39_16265, partial [Verrucomicrobiota bacterium]